MNYSLIIRVSAPISSTPAAVKATQKLFAGWEITTLTRLAGRVELHVTSPTSTDIEALAKLVDDAVLKASEFGLVFEEAGIWPA